MRAERFTALLAAAIALAAITVPRTGAAQGRGAEIAPAAELRLPAGTPRSRNPVSAALLLGYGATLDGGGPDGGKGSNGFGVGFGATAGYDFSLFYVGARFMFFLGGAADVGDAVVSRKETTLGLDAGIAFALAQLTLRPQVGFGLAIQSAERGREDADGVAVTTDDSSEDLYVAPGLAALYAVGDSMFIGVDAQVPLIITGSTLIGLTILGSAGMRF
jgi:hypothetical protein